MRKDAGSMSDDAFKPKVCQLTRFVFMSLTFLSLTAHNKCFSQVTNRYRLYPDTTKKSLKIAI